jgi:hypothetical protein
MSITVNKKKTYRASVVSDGKLNLKTGLSRYLDLNNDKSSTVEVWKSSKSNDYVLVMNGNKPIFEVGDSDIEFSSDQTNRFLFNGTMVDSYLAADYMQLNQYSSKNNKLNFYVYK